MGLNIESGSVVALTSGGPCWNVTSIDGDTVHCFRYDVQLVNEALPLAALQLSSPMRIGTIDGLFKTSEDQNIELSSMLRLTSGGPIWNVESIDLEKSIVKCVRFGDNWDKEVEQFPVNSLEVTRKKKSILE